MNTSPANDPGRILVIGRSPSVLVDTVEILRGKGYSADATNQFEDVLDDYDVHDIGIVVFGGMVPADTKQYLRQQIGERNAEVTFVQGLAGIAGLIAAQVEGVITESEPDGSHVVYDQEQRSVHLALHKAARVTAEAWWHTSFTPPEPASTSMQVLDAELEAGSYNIALPAEVPSVASFLAVTIGSAIRTFTVGAMPRPVTGMVPTGSPATASPSPGNQLPPVSEVTHAAMTGQPRLFVTASGDEVEAGALVEDGRMIGDRWGVSEGETLRSYSCDDFVVGPTMQAWRGVSIEAPAEAIWPWVAQVRLAPYSYDWIDNRGRRSPRHLVGLREPQAGDRFTTAGGRELGRIISVDPGKQLTGTIMGAFMSYVLVPHEDDVTRLLLKVVLRTSRWRAVGLCLGDLIMTRRQLLNFKQLAERHQRQETALA